MKICVITAATNTIPRFRLEMLRTFRSAGCEVVVLGDEPVEKWTEFFKVEGISYRIYPVSRNGINPIIDLKTYISLRNILKEEAPNSIFTYQAKPNIYGSLAARSAGIESVFVMMGGLGSVFTDSGLKAAALKSLVGFEYRLALRYVTRVFFQNEDDLRTFLNIRAIDSHQAAMVRGSGVNLKQFCQKPLSTEPSFLFIGRLVRGKGVFEYLEACRMLKHDIPDVECHLVGPFDTNPTSLTQEQLNPYVEDGTVIYHGEQEDVRPFLERCTAFVLPSYYGEGTPKSALEAMATGRAVIAADAVGSREVVHDGRNGFLVPPRNASAVYEAMKSMVETVGSADQMGAASRSIAEEYYDVDRVNAVICETMGIGRLTDETV